jgi:UDP-glucose 4-epimerase
MKKQVDVLVTGGAGFIGSHLVESLASQGLEILVIDNLSVGRKVTIDKLLAAYSRLSFELFDVAFDDFNSLKNIYTFGPDIKIVHLAARADIVPSIEDPTLYFDANVVGTQRLLEFARQLNCKRFIYAASSSCYGIPAEYPTKEDARISCEYPYALTKYLGEELVTHYSKIFNLSAISLRFFNVYGPRARTSGTYGAVFGVFLGQKFNDLPLTIVGDGEQTRDFTFVTDVADAIVASLSVPHPELPADIRFNIGSGKTISVNEVARLISDQFVYIPKRPGEPDCTFADFAKFTALTGWTPKVNIREGVSRLLEASDDWKDSPAWTPESIEEATRSWFEYLS